MMEKVVRTVVVSKGVKFADFGSFFQRSEKTGKRRIVCLYTRGSQSIEVSSKRARKGHSRVFEVRRR